MIESSPRDVIREVVEQFVREELSQDNAHIASVVAEMLDAGGKHLRPHITMLAGRARVPSAPEDPVLASYMELIHVATLVHDDVVDGADTRRGRGSTNFLHGNRFSVLAGDYLFAWVFKKITQGYATPIPTILSAMLAEICNGEVLQLGAAGDIAVTKERYFEIIGKKTAELFASCAEVGAIRALHHAGVAPSQRMREDPGVIALRNFGWRFGLAFQIRDDLLDVTADEAALGKPAGSDLREHRITLPLIFELEIDRTELHETVGRYFAGKGDVSGAIIEHLRASDCIARTKSTIAQVAESAQNALEDLPESPARDELAGMSRNLTVFSS